MPSGKKFGKPTYQPASLDPEASSTLARVRARMDRVNWEVTNLVKQILSQETGEDSQLSLSDDSTGYDEYDAKTNKEIRESTDEHSGDD